MFADQLVQHRFLATRAGCADDAFARIEQVDQRGRGHLSSSRGINSERLQGCVRISSWALINSSQAVAQAPEDPGTQKM
jgi:hypothetical protein